MHGRKRTEYKAHQRDPKVVASLTKKAEQWFALSEELAKRRKKTQQQQLEDNNENDINFRQTNLALSEKLLTVNPDPLYLWNHRRELLLTSSTGDDSTSTQPGWDLAEEQKLTQAALEGNPKAYGAWFHRKWAMVQFLQRTNETISKKENVMEQELALTVLFLQRDERNFHCWNYRRFVVSLLLCLASEKAHQGDSNPPVELMKTVADGSWKYLQDDAEVVTLMGAQVVPSPGINLALDSRDETAAVSSLDSTLLEREWDFSTQKIQENFSNFSAFHYRSKLLPLKLLRRTAHDKQDEDVESMHQFHARVESLVQNEVKLIENAVFTEPDDQTAWWYHRFLIDSLMTSSFKDEDWLKDLLGTHLESLQELLEDDDSLKWLSLGILHVLQALNHPVSERKLVLEKLIHADPDRSERYRYLLQQLHE